MKLKWKPAYSWQRLKTRRGRECPFAQEVPVCNRHGHQFQTLSKSAA